MAVPRSDTTRICSPGTRYTGSPLRPTAAHSMYKSKSLSPFTQVLESVKVQFVCAALATLELA